MKLGRCTMIPSTGPARLLEALARAREQAEKLLAARQRDADAAAQLKAAYEEKASALRLALKD